MKTSNSNAAAGLRRYKPSRSRNSVTAAAALLQHNQNSKRANRHENIHAQVVHHAAEASLIPATSPSKNKSRLRDGSIRQQPLHIGLPHRRNVSPQQRYNRRAAPDVNPFLVRKQQTKRKKISAATQSPPSSRPRSSTRRSALEPIRKCPAQTNETAPHRSRRNVPAASKDERQHGRPSRKPSERHAIVQTHLEDRADSPEIRRLIEPVKHQKAASQQQTNCTPTEMRNSALPSFATLFASRKSGQAESSSAPIISSPSKHHDQIDTRNHQHHAHARKQKQRVKRSASLSLAISR